MSPTTDNQPLNFRNPHRPIHAGVILLNSITEILDVAPIDVLTGLKPEFMHNFPSEFIPDELKDQAVDIQIHWVTETGGPAKMTAGIVLNATDSFTTCPPLDIVLMGAHDLTYQPSETELSFIRKMYETCTSFLTICGGFMAPLQAGILDNHTVTAPRFLLPMLREQSPNVKWTEKRWEHDRKIWTSGALLNGTDMVRVWASEMFGSQAGVKGGKGGEQDDKDRVIDVMLEIGAWPVRDDGYELEDERKRAKEQARAERAKMNGGLNGLKEVGVNA